MSNLTVNHNLDFVLLSETKLNPKYKMGIDKYNMIRRDRPKFIQGGGTAILVKDSIKFEKLHPPCLVKAKILEATVIKLNINHTYKLFIICAYAAGNHKMEFIPELQCLFEELDLVNPDNLFILAGDLNAKHTAWSNSSNNPRGIALNAWYRENEIGLRLKLFCSFLPSYPRGNSFLDLCLADMRLNFNNITDGIKMESIPYDSDHNAVKISLAFSPGTPFVIEIPSNRKMIKYNFARTNWEAFAKHLNSSKDLDIPNNRNLSNQEIDIYLKQIEDMTLEAIAKTVPKIKQSYSLKGYTTQEICGNLDTSVCDRQSPLIW